MSQSKTQSGALPLESFETSFPSSHKIFQEVQHGPWTLRVPKRRIHLSGDEPPLDVYDTTGPQGLDVTLGAPALRRDWIEAR
ncbi:MAG: phosphomethylpyrimidine synthase, partial [Planctomycetes bacterium]|nr:phosphomethylpyrimidine synthase [Planctomycetota bacterium]